MRHFLGVVIGIVSALSIDCSCNADQPVRWQATGDEVEFGVTAVVGGAREQSPSTIETGYNGAWIFGDDDYFYGIGQTFNVSSLRTLESIELRVAGYDFRQASGQFEVAVYRFDTVASTPAEKLVSVIANAEDYSHLDATRAKLASFDFSSSNLLLNPAETYALSVVPTDSYTGGPMTLQSGFNTYSDGNPYLLFVVPEPATTVLLTIVISAFLFCRHK
jgi:hypothetical protein